MSACILQARIPHAPILAIVPVAAYHPELPAWHSGKAGHIQSVRRVQAPPS